MSVAVVVVDYGSHALVGRNFAGLGLAAAGAELVVVDNHRSAADSAAIAALAAEHGWRLLAQDRNLGFGAAVNLAVAASPAADVLLVVNPDLALTADVVTALAEAVRADPKRAISPRVLRPTGQVWFGGAHVDLDAGRVRGVPEPAPGSPRTEPWLSGACLALHRDLFERAGGFDEDYFLYWEDVDLSHRLLAAGATLEVRADLTVVHDVGATSHDRAEGKSPVYYYWICRNRLVYAAKHLGPRDRRRWLLGTPADVRRVLLRGGRKQFLTPWRSLWPGFRGAAAGALWMARHRGGTG